MERYNHAGGSTSAPTPSSGADSNYPSNGDPAAGTPASVPGAYWRHMITEEMRQAIVDSGQVPDSATLNQLSAAIHPIDTVTATQYRLVVINGVLGLEAI